MCLGIPGRIEKITDSDNNLAIVNVSGVKRQINLTCIVDDAHPLETCVGDWVLIHVGFAMSRIDEEEAAKTLELMTELGEVQQEMDLLRSSSLN